MNIQQFEGKHTGQRCFILGSGPSLATMDLSSLRDEITFSCNRGYLMFSKLGFLTTYWALEDMLDAEQWRTEFNSLIGPTKFVAADVELEGCQVPFSRAEGFSTQPPFKFGGTVMHFMLQLATYMGCSEAYLLGNDFRWNELSGTEWVVTGVDDNHFDSNYWPKGARSFPPQPDRMRRAFFGARNHGMRIVNITPNSALDVFEMQAFGDYLPPIHMEQHPAEIDELVELVKELQPHHVIEIGVNRGGTSALWHELNTGLVIGIDDKTNTLAMRFPRFRSILGSSHNVQQQVASLLNGEQADFLFVDGDHSYDGAQQDFDDYRTLVRTGGLIAFHDINADGKYFSEAEQGGVPAFWKSLNCPRTEISIGADWGGIGVVRV